MSIGFSSFDDSYYSPFPTYTWMGTVDSQWGTISPHFEILRDGFDPYKDKAENFTDYTSGQLKYLHKFKGKTVRITLEILD